MMNEMPPSPTLPAPRDFQKLTKTHTLVPVYRTVTADLETPVSAFLRVAAAEPQAFLLESVEGGERVGRYTFIGLRPYRTMVARGNSITVQEGKRSCSFTGDIFEELKRALSEHTPARLPGLPPFTAGAVGYFAYDVVRQIEKLPEIAKDDLQVPDACLMFFDEVMACLCHGTEATEQPGTQAGGAAAEDATQEGAGRTEDNAGHNESKVPECGEEDEGIYCLGRCVPVRTVAAI
jgi:anthranilate/para-aminobenzoate synthase component I